MQANDDLRYWIGFQRIPGVGSRSILELNRRFGSLAAAWNASAADLADAGVNNRISSTISEHRTRIDLDHEMEELDRHDLTAVTYDDVIYPRLLREIDHPPAVLYVRGDLRPEDDVSIGMVGTRRATQYGIDMAKRLASDLARSEVTVVSGLALGVDTASHRAALEAGGRTIAVCGCGLDTVYPPKNRRLAHEIAANGALISEYPVGTKPDARNFPARNRIISGIVRGLIVVEAPRKSGALITASFAADQGRDVYAVPGSALSRASDGCHKLIRDGATLVTNARQIMEALNIESAHSAVQSRMVLPESDVERDLFELIGAEPRHINELCRESNLTIQETNGLLLAMELKGLIRQQGAQHYVRA